MRNLGFCIFLTILVSGCYLTKEVPKDQNIWEYGFPSEFGMNDDLLFQTNELIRVGTYENIHSLMIIKEDHLIYERHYGANNRHAMKSVDRLSLLFSQMAIGIAINEGLIENVDVPIWTLLPDYESLFLANTNKQAITIKHLMTHRSGLSWNEAIVSVHSENSDINLMKQSSDWVEFVLSKPLEAPPGVHYSTHTGTGIILSKIIKEVSGVGMDQYLQTHLFGPMGISEYSWEFDPKGITNGADGLSIATIDLAKVGYMLLEDGLWMGKDIISFDWIIESTSPQYVVSNQFGIGYYWWFYNDDYAYQYFPFTTNDVTFLTGYNGTSLYTIPHQNMLIVITANNSFYDFIYNPSRALYDNILDSFR